LAVWILRAAADATHRPSRKTKRLVPLVSPGSGKGQRAAQWSSQNVCQTREIQFLHWRSAPALGDRAPSTVGGRNAKDSRRDLFEGRPLEHAFCSLSRACSFAARELWSPPCFACFIELLALAARAILFHHQSQYRTLRCRPCEMPQRTRR